MRNSLSSAIRFLSKRQIKRHTIIMLFAVLCTQTVSAQMYLKSTIIGRSKYHDTNEANPGSKGSANVIRAGLQLPLSIKADTVVTRSDSIPTLTVWGVRFDGSYSHFNSNTDQYDFPGDVYNYRAGVVYLHTLNKKWSLYSTLGVGVYTTSSGIRSNQIVGEGALIFLRTITPNLKVGLGLAFDNTFGFPMLYPGLVVDWAIDGKGGRYFARLNSNEVKAGIKYNEKFQVYASFDAFGASALYKNKLFTHLSYAAGITPEFKVGKHFSIPITLGVNLSRNMYLHDRNLTDFFSYMAKDNVPHFAASPYVSFGINYGLK
jgi:hypothetical protein